MEIIVILKSAVRTFCLQDKNLMNPPNTQKNQEMTRLTYEGKRMSWGRRHRKKAKSSLNTPIAKCYCIRIICLMYRPSDTSHKLRYSLCLFSSNCSGLYCKPDDNCDLPGMPANTVSTLMCCYVQFIVSVCLSVYHRSTHSFCLLSEWLINAVTNAYGRFFIPNNLTSTHKSGAVKDQRKTRVKNAYPLKNNSR